MSIKKSLHIILFTITLLLTAGASGAQARPAGLAAASADAPPHLSDEITISSPTIDTRLPSVAYNWKHHEYLVVWQTTWAMGTRDIRASRVSDAGDVLETFIIYEHATKDSFQPAVDYDPVNDRYLVVWVFDLFGNSSDYDLYGRFIPWDGPSDSLTAFSICIWGSNQWIPQVSYGRAVEEFLVVWINEGTPAYISGRRIKASDGSFPGSDSDITINHPTENRVNADVSYNLARNEYLIVYDNTADIFGIRLTGDLSQNFGGEFNIAGWPDTETHPAVAACKGADQYLVTWQSDQGTSNHAIYARFISGTGINGNVRQIDDTTGEEIEADVACSIAGTEYLVAWQTEYTNSKYGIWARVVEPDETMGAQFCIVHPSTTEDRTNPIIAGGHANYLTVWEHDTYMKGRLVATNPVFIPLVLRSYS